MKSNRVCEAQRSSLDIISTLPQPILETILCRLPTEEAARTSILSRAWRYKWTTIPKLEFYLYESSKKISYEKQVQGKNMDRIRKLLYGLHQILLSHQGPIHDFTLGIELKWQSDDVPFGHDQIILHLSKNHTVKKLALYGPSEFCWFNLPISVFSLHHLTELELGYVVLDHPPIFSGFGSLKSLSLHEVAISTKSLLHLLSNCPSLKNLNLFIGDTIIGRENCNIIELFKCLPAIEHLTTWLHVSEWLELESVPQELPTSLFHLRYFCFENICRVDGYGLAFLLVLIKCSPNLEKIKLESYDCYKEYSVVWDEYLDVWLEHLNELDIDCFWNTKPEMDFVKFILARSPKLKKVTIYSADGGDCYQEMEMLKSLLQAPRVSPVVITVM